MRLAWVFFSRVKNREVVIRVDEVIGYELQQRPDRWVRVVRAKLYRTGSTAVIPLDQLVVVP